MKGHLFIWAECIRGSAVPRKGARRRTSNSEPKGATGGSSYQSSEKGGTKRRGS